MMSEVIFGVPKDEQLSLINQFSKKALSKDDVFYFENKSVGDASIPSRYMSISHELLKLFAIDAKFGVSFMFNHSWADFCSKAVPYGKVIDSRLGVGTIEGETQALYLSKYIARSNEKVDGVSANDLIERIESGVLSDTSIGWGTDVMVCSICGMNYYGGQCSHWKGATYDMADGTKKVCTVLAMPPSIINKQSNTALYEESIVWDGAYPTAMLSMAKDGDIIELNTGKFQVLDDKLELPENELIYGRYSNGSILTMVKKSENNKIFAMKGGEKEMNKDKLETTDPVEEVAVEETTDEVVETPEVETQSISSDSPVLLKEQILEKLGKEYSIDEVLTLAKEGIDYHKQVVDEAIAMGVRAMGNNFPAETWANTFAKMSTQSIKDINATWETQAKNLIPAGRKTDPEVDSNIQVVQMPDEAFKV